MSFGNVTTRTFVAVLIASTAALIFRSWWQVELLDDGANRKFAADLSFLVVPPILALLLFPLWHSHKSFLVSLFERNAITWNVVYRAVAIGVLLHLFSWGKLIAGASFGWILSHDPQAIVGPEFTFQCNTAGQVFLGLAVMAFTVPVIEEVVHRGFIVSYFRRRGRFIAIILSTAIFTVFHKGGSWPFLFLAGLVLGYQYWYSGSLWPSLITHMTVNGMIQLGWSCVNIRWNPVQAELPLLVPGIISVMLMLVCCGGIVFLLAAYSRGTNTSSHGQGTS